jgi:hypothetical protein
MMPKPDDVVTARANRAVSGRLPVVLEPPALRDIALHGNEPDNPPM